MKSNYKKLGDYIREVNVRNTELKDLDLLGVSIQKEFIPSIANTIGTDMSKYKIVKKNQFAYGTVTSRNSDKISIALLENYDEALISQAYISFEVIDDKMLLPEYLMMWFRRQEFDRYARYISYGSAREVFSWEDMCNVKLPVPTIERQREIVREYNIILNRIELNNKINKKLEEMSEVIFKHWFVDFEFLNEEGKPYKSSGGEMVESELGMIPKGWKVNILEDISKVSAGGDKPKSVSEFKSEEYKVPIYSNGIEKEGLYGYTDKAKIFEESVTISARGTIGFICLRQEPYVPIVRLLSVIPSTTDVSAKYLYFMLKRINIIGTGTTQQQLTVPAFNKIKLYIPKREVMVKFTKSIHSIFEKITNNKKQNEELEKLRDTLLPKLMLGEISVPLNDIEI